MSRWISKDGQWHPAKEKVSLTNHGKAFKHPKTGETVATGDPYIYEGPDRKALFELWEIDKSGKTTTLGVDFRKSPDFLDIVRKFNFKDAEEYLAYVGYDKEQVEADFKKNASTVTKHELPKRVEEIKMLGGGVDTAGTGVDRYGGFGETPKD